jgi:hypothetical protein
MSTLGQHPMINLLQNSGEKSYEHHHEGGEHHGGDMELGKLFSSMVSCIHAHDRFAGHCSFSVRNQKQHTFMRITYDKKTLSVNVKKEDALDWTLCASVPNVEIEKGYLDSSSLIDVTDILRSYCRTLHGIKCRHWSPS